MIIQDIVSIATQCQTLFYMFVLMRQPLADNILSLYSRTIKLSYPFFLD